jgi:hypothetical protein
MQPPDLAVVYLLRKVNPDHLFRAFLDSVARFAGGRPYEAIVLHKGFAAGVCHPLVECWMDGGAPARTVATDDTGFDLGAYRVAARATAAPRVLFLNSYSRLLAPDWLAKLAHASDRLGPASLVGAAGSWEALDDTTPFPNICLRSNAFLIERERYLAFPHRLDTKRDCNLFEAGPDNMTRRIRADGGRVAVVDRDGRMIDPEEWPQSLTFRSGNQERLLVADNRTMDYQTAGIGRRRRRAARAFGDSAYVTSQSMLQRWLLRRRWSHGLPLSSDQ